MNYNELCIYAHVAKHVCQNKTCSIARLQRWFLIHLTTWDQLALSWRVKSGNTLRQTQIKNVRRVRRMLWPRSKNDLYVVYTYSVQKWHFVDVHSRKSMTKSQGSVFGHLQNLLHNTCLNVGVYGFRITGVIFQVGRCPQPWIPGGTSESRAGTATKGRRRGAFPGLVVGVDMEVSIGFLSHEGTPNHQKGCIWLDGTWRLSSATPICIICSTHSQNCWDKLRENLPFEYIFQFRNHGFRSRLSLESWSKKTVLVSNHTPAHLKSSSICCDPLFNPIPLIPNTT